MAYDREWPYISTNAPHYPAAAAATRVSEHIFTCQFSLRACSVHNSRRCDDKLQLFTTKQNPAPYLAFMYGLGFSFDQSIDL